MAINRDIVATRKLNKMNKARLGRGGDTKIREVDGRDSHVNALEAYLIDVDRKAGEEYTKRVGAGTTNPLTGMPEYQGGGEEVWQQFTNGNWGLFTVVNGAWSMLRSQTDSPPQGSTIVPEGTEQLITFVGSKPEDTVSLEAAGGDPIIETPATEPYGGPAGKLTYEQLSGMEGTELEDYLKYEFKIGEGNMSYIEGFKDEPFEFLQEQKDLTMGGLESQEATLGRTTTRGVSQAAGAARTAASKSGLATSGTITSGLEEQKRGLFQDFTAGTKDIGLERAGADLDFRQSEYLEKQRQLDEMYADIAAIPL